MSHTAQKFSSKFPPSSETEWRDLAQAAIKGADFDETLVKRTEDGIAKGPLFTKDDLGPSCPILRNKTPHLDGRPWHIGALVDYPGIKTANLDLLEELKGGASSILIDQSTAIRSKGDVERLLAGVHCDLVPIALMPSADNFQAAAVFASYFKAHPKIAETNASLGYAPDYGNDLVPELAKWVLKNAPHWKALSINARAAHEAGGSPAQELALMLSQGCSFIRALLSADNEIDDVLGLMDIYVASDQDSHQNIIKFRAARLLWAKLAESFGPSESARNCTINAISSERMMAAQDPWSNMIRLSAASFGAICGGADTITLLPFTQAIGLATPFAKRISRNIQLMMMEESHLGQVNDPAHGSFMHEKLSYDLAEKSWSIFQHMQSIGEPLDWLKKEITKTANERAQKIENNEVLLVGVNQFAKPDVRKAEVRKAPQIKPRSGDLITATSFEDAIAQAENGHIIPPRGNSSKFGKIRLSETFDKSGDA